MAKVRKTIYYLDNCGLSKLDYRGYHYSAQPNPERTADAWFRTNLNPPASDIAKAAGVYISNELLSPKDAVHAIELQRVLAKRKGGNDQTQRDTESDAQRSKRLDEWRSSPETAPDWFILVDLLDMHRFFIEDVLYPYPFSTESFDEEDLSALKAIAPDLPFVLCDEYDTLGGDEPEAALIGLLTKQGSEKIMAMRSILEEAYKLAKNRGWQ